MISYDFMPMQQPSELVDNNESILEYTSAHNHYNWADTVLQNITGFLHVLTPNGSISYCSESCTELTGYQPNELTGRSLTDYIHADDIDTFIHNFRYAFQTMSRVKIHYRLRCKNDSYLLVEFIGQPKRELPDNSTLYFFGIAQPYLSRSNGLIDSYMEIRMEYEWFKKRVYELLSTQNIIIPQQEDYYPNQYFIPTTTTTTTTNINNLDEPSQSNWKPHHYTPSVTSSTDENIPKVLPTLQVNDTVFTEKWKRRKKHNKSFDDYVCNDCGTTSSPEWRKGPNGPKTLCNACGLRWAKKNKKDLKEN